MTVGEWGGGNHSSGRHGTQMGPVGLRFRLAALLVVAWPTYVLRRRATEPPERHLRHSGIADIRVGKHCPRMVGKVERNDIRNVVGAFLAAYGFVAFFCFIYLVERWAHLGPTPPDPSHGYVYSHNEHGSITYFTAFQATSWVILFSTSIPISFVGMFVTPKRNVVYRRGFLSIGATWDQDDPKRLQRFGYGCGAVAAPILLFVLGPLLVKALNQAGIVLSLG